MFLEEQVYNKESQSPKLSFNQATTIEQQFLPEKPFYLVFRGSLFPATLLCEDVPTLNSDSP
jgi:hypothetical protein